VGTAGASAALFLARAGHQVTLYERVPEPGPVGAGLVLQPIGLHALSRLGLGEQILAAGARLDQLRLQTLGGRKLATLRYQEFRPGWFGLGIHRGVLFTALLDAVRRQEGLTLRLGVEVTATRPRADKVLLLRGGEELAAHDLCVVADGAGGALHPARFSVKPYPWGALWLVTADTAHPPAELYQVVDGARRFYGLLPTGTGPDGKRVVSVFWSLRVDQHEAWKARGLEAWKREMATFDPRAEGLLANVDDPAQLVLARYRDVRLPRFHEGRTVYLGDAAHATSPQLGQGANLALFDAMILGDLLAAEGGADVPAALARYTAQRRGHLGFYQFMSSALTPFFQSGYPLVGTLRDLGMPLAFALGPVRRRMLRTMCGLEQGVAAAPLALPP
jgi:2-polyprenyl-6-methoxyphenol hydroxylase-like FAD-dependent oxidoreductase